MAFRRTLLSATVAAVAAASWGQGGDTPAAADGAPPPAESPADPNAPLPDPDSSPFDYEASEEISEDLSVSFPVDI